MRRITRQELAQSDGQDDRAAHVSVGGRVYDVSASKRWPKGRHMNSHLAGADLTQALGSAPHGAEVFERVPQVGELDTEAEGAEAPAPSGLVALALAQHPHPMSVHFPIALMVTAALFTVTGLVLGGGVWHTAALLNLGFGTLSVPFAIGAGLLSQQYNYAGVWSPIFRAKLLISIFLAALAICALCIRLFVLDADTSEGPWYWIYNAAVIALAPVVASLGYMGGRITFPR